MDRAGSRHCLSSLPLLHLLERTQPICSPGGIQGNPRLLIYEPTYIYIYKYIRYFSVKYNSLKDVIERNGILLLVQLQVKNSRCSIVLFGKNVYKNVLVSSCFLANITPEYFRGRHYIFFTLVVIIGHGNKINKHLIYK